MWNNANAKQKTDYKKAAKRKKWKYFVNENKRNLNKSNVFLIYLSLFFLIFYFILILLLAGERCFILFFRIFSYPLAQNSRYIHTIHMHTKPQNHRWFYHIKSSFKFCFISLSKNNFFVYLETWYSLRNFTYWSKTRQLTVDNFLRKMHLLWCIILISSINIV